MRSIGRAWRMVLFASLTVAPVASGADRVPSGIPRMPDVSATHIVFIWGHQLWLVPRAGGTATLLTSEASPRSSPRFSPDGLSVAFTGAHDAIYTIPVSGGAPSRVTHHPGATDLCDWTPDGRLLFMTDAFASFGNFDGGTQSRIRRLYTVAAAGGLPTTLPLTHAANGAISGDGEWLAYTPYAEGRREYRKRYEGGLAPDVWLFNLRTRASSRLTAWPGTETAPMWHGGTLYYLSDHGIEKRLNIWTYDMKSQRHRQLTHFTDFDVRWPSIGPGASGGGEIVLVNGARLHLVDLETGAVHPVHVAIPAPALDAQTRAVSVDASAFLGGWGASPDGRRAVFEARGDLWLVPLEGGKPSPLTRTSNVAERSPSWSPDGRWIAYVSDATDDYELYVIDPDAATPPRRLTHLGMGYRYTPVWSPDSQWLAFADSSGSVYLQAPAGGETRKIHQDAQVRQPPLNWSPDSSALVFTATAKPAGAALWLYEVATGQMRQLTEGGHGDRWPTFDRNGDFLFFVSERNFDPLAYDSVDYTNFIYPTTELLMAAPLRRGLGTPWGQVKDGAGDRSVVDADGLERRAVVVAAERRKYWNLAVGRNGELLFAFTPADGSPGEATPSIGLADFAEWRRTGRRQTATVLSGTGDFRLFDGGARVVAQTSRVLARLAVAADQKIERPTPLSGMAVEIERPAEWRQIFGEAWRLYRDFFYDPAMRGLDWVAQREKYRRLLADCATRQDLDYVLGEMVGELSSSHVYVHPPADDREPSEDVGMLGVDFEIDRGAYRIAKIHDGAASDASTRNPLRMPGVEVKEGDYLLAVNGRPLDTQKDPWGAFAGTAWKDVTLTVSPEPTSGPGARDVVVQAGGTDVLYRHAAWVEANRATVNAASGGRVGYLFLHVTSEYGFREFTRQFGTERKRDALIVDARWNQGGHIPFHLVDLLGRRQVYFRSSDLRRGERQRNPDYMLEGPRCLMTNGMTMSGGDFFAYLFRRSGLGKLVGERTMGSMAGGGGVSLPFVDGGASPPPNVGFYDSSDAWPGEGQGITPDLEVVDDPAAAESGPDPQLQAAVRLMLAELRRRD